MLPLLVANAMSDDNILPKVEEWIIYSLPPTNFFVSFFLYRNINRKLIIGEISMSELKDSKRLDEILGRIDKDTAIYEEFRQDLRQMDSLNFEDQTPKKDSKLK